MFGIFKKKKMTDYRVIFEKDNVSAGIYLKASSVKMAEEIVLKERPGVKILAAYKVE